MKTLKTKLQGFLRRLLDGRRIKKIYPSPCLIEPTDRGIPDNNAAEDYDNAEGFSEMGLLLEPNPEKEFTYQDLQSLTNNFSEENLFGHTQFGKLYLGRIPDGWKGMEAQDVTVKMWNQDTGASVHWEARVHFAKPNDALNRMKTEINFLSQPEIEMHPNMATVVGYCFEESRLGVVYSIEPRNTIRVFADHGPFTWALRIKVALELALLVEFLHCHQPQYLVRNLAAAHIMLDKEWNPVLVDFSMLIGGGFGDTTKCGRGCPLASHGYLDLDLAKRGWTEKTDVYTFGVILLELIFKCRFDAERFKGYKRSLRALGPYLYERYGQVYGKKFTFANDTNFGEDQTFDFSDGHVISVLGVMCLHEYPWLRPTMKEIIVTLQKLLTSIECRLAELELKKLEYNNGGEMVKTDDAREEDASSSTQPVFSTPTIV